MSFYPNIPIIHTTLDQGPTVSNSLPSRPTGYVNFCISIIFTSFYCFFKNFSSWFIYSCVLSSVFYAINEWIYIRIQTPRICEKYRKPVACDVKICCQNWKFLHFFICIHTFYCHQREILYALAGVRSAPLYYILRLFDLYVVSSAPKKSIFWSVSRNNTSMAALLWRLPVINM